MTEASPSTSSGARLELYSKTAHSAAASVLSEYSTSFGLAAQLLPQPTRQMIRGIYALVRVADEIVDGTAAAAGFSPNQCAQQLDHLETETLTAMRSGFSTNMVVHSFAQIARQTGIDDHLGTAFFTSMRRDLEPSFTLTEPEYRLYVYGSAEVVGLMCLRAFTWGHQIPTRAISQLETGAQRLGAAFQTINFLRDLADDQNRLGRIYIPGTEPWAFTQQRKAQIIAEIEADLQAAHAVIPMLPAGARRATAAAAALFGELTARLSAATISELQESRISVPTAVKLRVIGAAVLKARCRS